MKIKNEHKLFARDIDIRFRDIDAMGHVNNSVYFTYFEYGRVKFFHSEAQKRTFGKFSFILAHIRCDYTRPVTMEDKITVQMWIGKIGSKSFTFQYRLVDRTDPSILFASAESVQVCFDYRKNESVPVAEELRVALSTYLKPEMV